MTRSCLWVLLGLLVACSPRGIGSEGPDERLGAWPFEDDLIQFLEISAVAKPEEGSFRVRLANSVEFSPHRDMWSVESTVLAVEELAIASMSRGDCEGVFETLSTARVTSVVAPNGAFVSGGASVELHDALGPGIHSVVDAMGIPPLPHSAVVQVGEGTTILEAESHSEETLDDEAGAVHITQPDLWTIELLESSSRPVQAHLESHGALEVEGETMSHRVVLDSQYWPMTPVRCGDEPALEPRLIELRSRWLQGLEGLETLARAGAWVWRARLKGPALDEARGELEERTKMVGRAPTPCAAQRQLLDTASFFAPFLPHSPLVSRVAFVVPPDAEAWSSVPQLASQLASDSSLASSEYAEALRRHEDSAVRRWATAGVMRRAALLGDEERVRELWDGLSEEGPKEPPLIELLEALSPDRPLARGRILSTLPLLGLEGEPVEVDVKRHQLVVGWATWCEACMEELPRVVELASRHPEISILTVNFDPAEWKGRAEDAARSFPEGWVSVRPQDPTGFMEAWGSPNLPFHVLTDVEGAVVVGPPFDELERVRSALSLEEGLEVEKGEGSGAARICREFKPD